MSTRNELSSAVEPTGRRAENADPPLAPPAQTPADAPEPRAGTSAFGALVKKLLGREPTPLELAEFHRVRDALNLRDNDALWLVLLALQHGRRELEQSLDSRLANARETAEAILESARAQFLQQFPAELRKLAEQRALPARGYTGPVVVSGLLAGVVLLIVGLGAVGFLAYELGERAGYEQGVLAQRATLPPAPPAQAR